MPSNRFKLPKITWGATAGTGTLTIAGGAGATTFSTSQAGLIANGSQLTVAGVTYTVSAFSGTTTCTLAGAPNQGPVSFTIVFFNTLSVGYPLDSVRYGSEPRAGSVFDRSTSGVEDAWITGTDYLLTGEFRWIPQVDTAAPLATGWDGATGFAAFMEFARNKNIVRFYPDAGSGTFVSCYLAEPMQGVPDSESDGTKKITLTFRNVTAPWTGY